MSKSETIISISCTLCGLITIIKGYPTDGLLLLILGELVDIPKKK